MLGLTDTEIHQLEAMKHPVTDKVLLLLKTISDDPTLRMYSSAARFAARICDEMDGLGKNILTGSPKEDKIFERANAFIKEFNAYNVCFKEGRDILKKKELLEFTPSDKETPSAANNSRSVLEEKAEARERERNK